MHVQSFLGAGIAPPAYLPSHLTGGRLVRVPTYQPPPTPVAPTITKAAPRTIIREVLAPGRYAYYDPSRAAIIPGSLKDLAAKWRKGEITFEEAFPGQVVGPTAEAAEADVNKADAETEGGKPMLLTEKVVAAEKPNMLPWLVLGSLLLFGG